MKILQLINRVPWPLKDGGAIAMYNMTKALNDLGNEVHLLCLNTNKHYVRQDEMPPLFSELESFGKVDINTDVTRKEALKNLFTGKSYNIERFYSADFEDALIRRLRAFTIDLVQLEGLHMAVYLDTIRKNTKAKVVLRAHNIENRIWQRLAAAEKSPMRKAYLSLLARRLKKFEQEVVSRVDAVIPITNSDAAGFLKDGCKSTMFVSPAGIDLSNYAVDHSALEWPTVFHLGALDWMPNVQGIEWFLKEVWPKVHSELPHLKFFIAGRNTPESILSLKAPGVVVSGEVKDAKAFARSKAIMVVPLLSGSGMRIKIIEGMALGKTIVSTSIGAEGIGVSNEENILIADSAEEFAGAIAHCVRNRSFTEAIGENARKFVEAEFENNTLVARLLIFYEILLKGGGKIELG